MVYYEKQLAQWQSNGLRCLWVTGSNPVLILLLFTNLKGVDNMNNLLQHSKLFLKKNASTILTCIGGAGVITTTVMAVKATPKAISILEKTKEEKGEDLTKLEIIKVAGPVYIPTVIAGASTIACIFGANILNKRQQAAIMSAYALLDNSYKEYKNKVKELYGDDSDRKIKEEIVKDKYEENSQFVEDEKQLFYDEFSQRYFESTTEDVLRAEYELNKMLAKEYGVFLNEFYDLLGIETVDYGDYLGWSTYELVETSGYSWVDFNHHKFVLDDGLECTIISMSMEPTFDFENY